MRSRRRNTELGLLVMVVVIIGAAYVLASLGSAQKIPLNVGPFLLMVLGLMLFAHMVVRRLAPDADPVLLPVAALLNGLGYVVITSLNERLAALQATWTLVGVACFAGVLIVVRRTRSIERYRYTFAFVGIVLLLLPLVPHVGKEIHGSKIWVGLGPIGFQPGELAKIALAIFFASYLVEKRELLAMRSFRLGPLALPDPKHLGPVLVAWGVSIVVMVAERDLGSSLLFFTLFIVMLWVATSRPSYLAVGAVMFAAAAYVSWRTFGHVQSRVTTWLDPWKDPQGDSFQVVKGWFAMANGGLTGTGLGLGAQERIPFIESDFIFVAIAQEMGLFGATLVLCAYLIMVGSGLRIATRSEHAFDKLLAVGLTTLLGVQAFIIIGGVVRVLPLTGVTLPFIAYGGSSLVSSWLMLALLLRISDETHRRVAEKQAVLARMNTQIRRLGIGLLACYIALFGMLNWIQVIHKDQLDGNALNTLRVKQQFNKERGTITSADGVLLAQSVDLPDGSAFDRQRNYPTGDLFAQLTGFYSFKYASSGLERSYDNELSGQTVSQQIRGFADLLNPRPQVGNLTISVLADLQQVAKDALGQREGSVVAIDPKTGELLAFWSYPSFDPNPISSVDSAAADAAWTADNAAPGQPLRAHQYQERYFPGSTFKVVTGSIGVETGTVTVDAPSYPVATSYTPPNTTKSISNFGGESCGGTLYPILRVSCNSAFAQMGTETIGPDPMIAGAERFGFNSKPPIDLPAPVASAFPTSFFRNLPALAQASIGQNDVQATPLQMALVASAIANNGSIMKPHTMRVVRDSEGNVISRFGIGQWVQPISAQTAATMKAGMLDVAAYGTATRLQIPGYEVGGKTGTAQLGTDPPASHTWIMGFAGPPGDPQIAISVVVLNQPGFGSEATGGRVAAPIAQAVMKAYLDDVASGKVVRGG